MNRSVDDPEEVGRPPPINKPAVIVVMGVAGSGKSTIGRALAERLDWPFYEGDDYHPPANVARMAQGFPLTDEDRAPWLAALHDLINRTLAGDGSAVLAASALKEAYRQQLRQGNEGVVFVYLKGRYELIMGRMQGRHDHFFAPELLRSQFDTLETPHDAIVADVEAGETMIVDGLVETLRRQGIVQARPPA